MKRFVITLLITLSATITISSQTTSTGVWITSEQLKEANLVFVERDQFAEENSLLRDIIDGCERDNQILLKIDSLRVEQINNYEGLTSAYENNINVLNKQLKRKQRALTGWKIGGITVSVGLLIWLILK